MRGSIGDQTDRVGLAKSAAIRSGVRRHVDSHCEADSYLCRFFSRKKEDPLSRATETGFIFSAERKNRHGPNQNPLSDGRYADVAAFLSWSSFD